MTAELLSHNLYDLLKSTEYSGLKMDVIWKITIQILHALRDLESENIIHCDLKPENILLKNSKQCRIKIIDFGSSCYVGKTIYTYIQSWFYWAPEIILGAPYDRSIDMWSLGCIIAELYNGFPLFSGDTEQEQLSLVMQVWGYPPLDLIQMSKRKDLFFDQMGHAHPISDSQTNEPLIPNSKAMSSLIVSEDRNFIKFIDACLHWDPKLWLTPSEALRHEWIMEGIPLNVWKSYWWLVDVELLGQEIKWDDLLSERQLKPQK